MVDDLLSRLCTHQGSDAEAEQFAQFASQCQQQGQPELAATAFDIAYAMRPANKAIGDSRKRLLEDMSFDVEGLRFRYVPGGTFTMGSDRETDEYPQHPVKLEPYWMSETPISWSLFCTVMGWSQPPEGLPPDIAQRDDGFVISQANKIRLQYCEDCTITARDWHAHNPEQQWTQAGKAITSRELFGQVPREPSDRPWGYSQKPMVAVPWDTAQRFCEQLGQRHKAHFRLPTEAQWEKAARGGLSGSRFAWGEATPTETTCDFNRFDKFSIQPMRNFPPNGYGLYAMCGGIWEWTSDWYDGGYYGRSPSVDPSGPADGKEKVVRGGSWADCAEAVTVSFRSSLETGGKYAFLTPNIGFRVCCLRRSKTTSSGGSVQRPSLIRWLLGKRKDEG